MLTNDDIEYLIDCSYKIRLSVLKSLKNFEIGYLGACLAMADIFTSLYFTPLYKESNEHNHGIRYEIFLLSDKLVPLLLATQAHAGQISFKTLYQNPVLTTNQNHTIDVKKNRLTQILKLIRSDKSRNIQPNAVIITDIEELSKEDNFSLFSPDKCVIPKNVTFILDQGSLFSNNNDLPINKVLTITEQLTAYGWNLIECDGHNFEDIISRLGSMDADPAKSFILNAHTVSGKGIISIEGNPMWYNKVPSSNQIREFCCQLEESHKINKMRLNLNNR